MKTRWLLALPGTAMLVTTMALADDKAACLDAVSKGQRFKDNHELIEAQEQFRVCAAAVCPRVVQSDCATWLSEVDAALPSVVVTAKNGAGSDLVEVKVSTDGRPLVSTLDGHAVSINAGLHMFHFAGADGTSLDRQVLINEGEKNQAVAVVLEPAPAKPPVAPVPEPFQGGAASQPPPSGELPSPLKTLGWVLGGAGVVGLGVGTVFGVIALGDKNGAHCVNQVCDPGTTGGIKSAALVSDVGWIAGGVLLAGGAGFVLFARSGSAEPTAGVRLSPVLAASGGGIVARGRW